MIAAPRAQRLLGTYMVFMGGSAALSLARLFHSCLSLVGEQLVLMEHTKHQVQLTWDVKRGVENGLDFGACGVVCAHCDY